MANTETSICNSALIKIGAQRILSLDGSDKISRMMNEVYPTQRDALLYAHPWKFATKSIAPTEIAQPPHSNMPNKYQLPSDYLRIIGTGSPEDVWSVEDGFLYVDQTNALIKYVYRCTDVSKFTPGFCELLSAKIAADVCYSIVQSVTLRDQLIKEYERQLGQVRSYSAQEGSTKRVYADSWLHARY